MKVEIDYPDLITISCALSAYNGLQHDRKTKDDNTEYLNRLKDLKWRFIKLATEHPDNEIALKTVHKEVI